ncbi:MAG: hypothetical protein ABR520_03645 [Mycobacteriales bacterium]
MRWTSLFSDLEGQFAAAEDADLDAEVSDRTRREVATLRVHDRLRAAAGSALTLDVLGAGVIHGVVEHVAVAWLLVSDDRRREALVPAAALVGIRGLGALSATPGSESEVERRLGIGSPLRVIAQRREVVAVTLVNGATLHGVIGRVGADFFELAPRDVIAAHEPGAGPELRTIPFAALGVVRPA